MCDDGIGTVPCRPIKYRKAKKIMKGAIAVGVRKFSGGRRVCCRLESLSAEKPIKNNMYNRLVLRGRNVSRCIKKK